jgi:hypothetical protein
MSAHRAEFGQWRMGAALLVAALLDGWTALQTRDFGSLAVACACFRLATELCFPRSECWQARGPASSVLRAS